MASDNKKTKKDPRHLEDVRTGSLSRTAAMAGIGAKAGARLTSYSLATLFMSAEDKKRRKDTMMTEQAQMFADELGKLKGSVMKAGQMLALYGEYFLPPEVVEILRTLQDDSPALGWHKIEQAMRKELGAKFDELEVDSTPLAAASLGQVHRATVKATGDEVVIKIQYPGVAESIDSDLKTLGSLMQVARIIPKGPEFDQMMAEVREMLHREVDYVRELDTTEHFRQLLGDDPRFRVPTMYREFSGRKVMVSSYEPGQKVDGPVVAGLSQERRNQLGIAAFDLFLKEFFEWGAMQTDPHFGNYRIRLREDNEQGLPDQIVLFDFGAVRRFPDEFLQNYYELVRGAFWKDKTRLLDAADRLEFMDAGNPDKVKDNFAEVCTTVVEPFDEPMTESGLRFCDEQGRYNWGASDLPMRITQSGSKAALSFSFKMPPKEFIFLHRKMGGVFVFLAELGSTIEARSLLLPYMGSDRLNS